MMFAESLKLLEQYSVVILPALVVAEQVGAPLPAVPALLAVGALAASGRVSIPLVLGAIAVVALTAHREVRAGATTVMPPLAGIFAVGRLRFAFYELIGVLLWAGIWMDLWITG